MLFFFVWSKPKRVLKRLAGTKVDFHLEGWEERAGRGSKGEKTGAYECT